VIFELLIGVPLLVIFVVAVRQHFLYIRELKRQGKRRSRVPPGLWHDFDDEVYK
jgi:hypothetical protein